MENKINWHIVEVKRKKSDKISLHVKNDDVIKTTIFENGKIIDENEIKLKTL